MHVLRILALTTLITTTGLSAQSGGGPWTMPTAAEVNAIYPDLEALYIDLHKNPEIAFQETRSLPASSSLASTSPPASDAQASLPC
jgi:hypothetical protein